MADFILMTGDQAMFNPNCGQAIVIVRPTNLIGSGQAKVNGKYVCVDGDEKKVLVVGCAYNCSTWGWCGNCTRTS